MEEQQPKPTSPPENKSRFTTWLLCWLFGAFGLDRFYLRQIWTGILKLITLGGFGIWVLTDLIYTAFGDRKDKQGRSLEGTKKEQRILQIITLLILVTQVLVIVYFIVYGLPAIRRDAYRKSDAKSIQNTLILYQTDVSAALPKTTEVESGTKTVKFCDTSCESGSAFVPLQQYQPDKVLIRSYSAGLTPSDANTIIVMTDATCDGPKTHNMAILYMTEGYKRFVDTKAQHCLTVESREFNHISDPPQL